MPLDISVFPPGATSVGYLGTFLRHRLELVSRRTQTVHFHGGLYGIRANVEKLRAMRRKGI